MRSCVPFLLEIPPRWVYVNGENGGGYMNMDKSKIAVLATSLALLAAPLVPSASGDDTFRGALVGAALGAIVAHNCHNISTALAVPVGALAGGLLANAADNDYWRHDGYTRYEPRPWWRRYGYWDRPWYGYRDWYDRHPRPVVVVKQAPAPKVVPPPTKPANLHPGVDLIKIVITLSNGTSVDIPVLKVGDKFVGPQGEEYASLPTAKQLAEKYAK